MRAWSLIVIAMTLVGCGGSSVPTMSPADLSSPRMQGLHPRTIAIEVEDQRQVSAEDRERTEQAVGEAFGDVFSRESIEVAASSPNLLALTLQRPSTSLNNIDPDSCVELMGDLRFADGRMMTASAVGCAESRNALGMSYGGHVSGAFQSAAEILLKYIDEKYSGANDPLVFKAEKVEIPAFPEVGVQTLALTVADEHSEDGSLGRNLAEELKVALAKAGVKVDENASQGMKLTVSHPTENFAGRDKSTCIAFEATARFARGTAFGAGTSCRGLDETGHHRVLSQTLLALWTEYARLLGK